MLKKYFLLLFITFVCFSVPVVLAQEDVVLKNPASIEELVVSIDQTGGISTEGTPTYLQLNLTIPQQDSRQIVETEMGTGYDSFGNSIGSITKENPGNYFTYKFASTVRSKAYHLYSLPKTYVMPDDVKLYLKSTDNIQSDSQRIKTIAENLTKNAKDDFEKVAALAMWVNGYISYDLDYASRNLNAIEVLDTKKGVCAEYTTLFVALARSIGIPARYVSAFAYGKNGWERHAYSEVWIGEWVPVDVLWLEIGYLDATHIKFGHYLDNLVANTVRVYDGTIDSKPEFVNENENVTILYYKQSEKESNYDLYLSSDAYQEGDEGVAVLEFSPTEYVVAQADLEPCIGANTVVIMAESEKAKNVIARPGEKKVIYWKFNINSDLPNNYLFRCPLTLNSRSLTLKTANVTVNTGDHKQTNEIVEASLESNQIELGETQKVYVNAKNVGDPFRIGVVADETKQFDVTSDSGFVFEFVPQELGLQHVIVYTSNGEVFDLTYTVKSEISLEADPVLKDFIKLGEPENITVQIKTGSAIEKIVRIEIRYEDKQIIENIAVKGTYTYSKALMFSETGVKIVKIRVDDIEKARVPEVYTEPVIFYETKNDGKRSVLTLNVTKYKAKNMVVTISDISQTVGEIFGSKDLYFDLPIGKYTMKIAYEDAAGSAYGTEKEIEFKQSGILEMIAQFFKDLIDIIMAIFK